MTSQNLTATIALDAVQAQATLTTLRGLLRSNSAAVLAFRNELGHTTAVLGGYARGLLAVNTQATQFARTQGLISAQLTTQTNLYGPATAVLGAYNRLLGAGALQAQTYAASLASVNAQIAQQAVTGGLPATAARRVPSGSLPIGPAASAAVGGGLTGAAASALSSGYGPIAGAFLGYQLFSSGRDLQQARAGFAASSPTLSQAEREALYEEFASFARTYPGTESDLTRSAGRVVRAGVTDPQRAARITQAGAALASVDQVANEIGIDAVRILSQGYQDLTAGQAANLLSAGSLQGAINVEGYQRALAYVTPSASPLGVGADEVVGLTAFLTRRGLPAEQAGQNLGQLLAHAYSPSSTASRNYQELTGRSFADDIRRQGSVVDVIRQTASTYGTEQTIGLFGRIQSQRVVSQILEDFDGLNQALEATNAEMNNLSINSGSVNDRFQVISQESYFRLDQATSGLQSSFARLGNQLVDGVEPGLSALINTMSFGISVLGNLVEAEIGGYRPVQTGLAAGAGSLVGATIGAAPGLILRNPGLSLRGAGYGAVVGGGFFGGADVYGQATSPDSRRPEGAARGTPTTSGIAGGDTNVTVNIDSVSIDSRNQDQLVEVFDLAVQQSSAGR